MKSVLGRRQSICGLQGCRGSIFEWQDDVTAHQMSLRVDNLFSLSGLCDDLRVSCRVKSGDTVIVHASARSVGRVVGGAPVIVRAIQEMLGPEGTVLVPSFSAPQENGLFELTQTPSRTGFISECLRRDPGSFRSMHPTHSVTGWGRLARSLTAGHEMTTALGPDSPLHKAAKQGAAILMIGCDLTACSLIHVAEALVRPPYLGKVAYPGYDRALTLIDENGARRSYLPVDVPGDSAGFGCVQEEMDRRGLIQWCRLGAASVMRLNAMDCLDVAVEMLRADSAALLCDRPSCRVCPSCLQVIKQWSGDQEINTCMGSVPR